MSKEDEMDITIDELEQIIENAVKPLRKRWTSREDALISKYYGRVATNDLVKHLPGRNPNSVRLRAQTLGIPFNREA